MRLLVFTGLFCASALTGCKPGVIENETPPITAADLAVKHVYKSHNKKTDFCYTRFHDHQLAQLVSVAMMDAPDLRSAKARMIRAQQIAKGTWSTLWPSATTNGYADKEHFNLTGDVPPPFNELVFNKADIGVLALNFNYELDFWGKNRNNLASKLNEAFAARMDMTEAQLMVGASVASTYFELQNNMIQQRLAQENVRVLHELEGIVLDRAKKGIESDIPLKTAISNTQSARLAIQNYKRAELQSRHQLAVLLGKNPFNTRIETEKFTYNSKQLALPDIVSVNVLAQRPDITAALALTESAAHQIKVARAAFFPDINLRGVLSTQSYYFSQLFNVSFQAEGARAAVSLPIFDAGSRKANLGVKQAEFEMAVNQYNQTILNALQQVTDHMAELRTLGKQIQDQGKALHSTQTNYKLLNDSYAAGIIDSVQLLEIKQVLVQQKATLYSLQTRRKQAFVALLAALGGEVSV